MKNEGDKEVADLQAENDAEGFHGTFMLRCMPNIENTKYAFTLSYRRATDRGSPAYKSLRDQELAIVGIIVDDGEDH